MENMINKKYSIIYCDPPWSYQDTQKSGGTAFFGASARYQTMDNNDIARLPISNLADKNCALFMWATSPLLPEAFNVISKWGFRYKTIAFVWSKRTKNGKYVHNMGRWTMGNIELCLLATKGSPRRIRKDIKQIITATRESHSAKPICVRSNIIELMGDLPRIELFARKNNKIDLWGHNTFDGWDVWGNEVESDIVLDKSA